MVLDYETAVLLGVVGMMGVNQLVMRVGALKAHMFVFYPLQLINVAVGTWLILTGLPGFEKFPVVSWLVGLVFFFRTIQNNNARAEWLREVRREDLHAERREQLHAALAASGDDEDSDEHWPDDDSDEGEAIRD